MNQHSQSNVIPYPSQNPVTLTSNAASLTEIKNQVTLIQQVMREVMIEGEHYGTIPGCGDKKVLLKSGAEKLMLTFRLANDLDVQVLERQKIRVTMQDSDLDISKCDNRERLVSLQFMVQLS